MIQNFPGWLVPLLLFCREGEIVRDSRQTAGLAALFVLLAFNASQSAAVVSCRTAGSAHREGVGFFFFFFFARAFYSVVYGAVKSWLPYL